MSSDNPQEDSPAKTPSRSPGGRGQKWIVLGTVAVAFAGILYFFGDALRLESLAQRETELKRFQQEYPVLVYAIAFSVYVTITGLSLPGAFVMTLVFGWYFKFSRGTILVSFASTMGATLAFLLSRYLFRDAWQEKFADRLKTFNEALEREGAFYLFTLRLIPAVPFFVINVVMGLTKLRTRTFWWVSQVGMLPGTMVYVYAGSQVPDLQTLAEKGARAVFSGTQLTQITIAFVLLGVFPIAVKKILQLVKGPKAVPDNNTTD